MPTKLPYLILSSQGSLHAIALSSGAPTVSPVPSSRYHPPRAAPRTRSPFHQPASLLSRRPPRRHASTHSSSAHPSDADADADADPSWPRHAAPSPYDILHQRRGAPYSRRRFLQLVKLYHPDRHAGPPLAPSTAPRAVRVERYRLAVAAHEILSDPARRRAYDASGAGWRFPRSPNVSGYEEAASTTAGTEETWAYARDGSRRPWTSRDADGPFNNATWEDWEAWYERARTRRRGRASSSSGHGGGDGGDGGDGDGWGSGTSRPGTVLANGTSVLLMVVTAFVGIHEVRRAERRSQAYVAQLEKTHRAANKELRHRREGSRAAERGREGWVEGFLKGGNSGLW